VREEEDVPEPIPRTTARVLPVNEHGEVLLLQDQDPAHPGVLRWGSIGGATDAGETLVDAALRELKEETGIEVEATELTAPFLRSTYEFSWGGTPYRSDSTFFGLLLDRDVPISFDHLEEAEVGNVFAAAWWLPSDLARDGNAISDEMPAIMEAAVAAVLGSRR
jgi:8-oxo-dGTP pyrophosphatase MutT (NUDIX family)